jgi:hypothetical protein
MLYAGSKDAIARAAEGISVKLNATDSSEVSWESLLDVCNRF